MEKLILDTKLNRYQLIPLVLKWAKELERKSGSSGQPRMSTAQVIDKALQDILSGEVKPEEVARLTESRRK